MSVNSNIKVKTYRYNFTKEFILQVSFFSKLHQYDDRKVFKEEYEKWKKENCEMIDIEKRKLKENGYEGNVDEKIYLAARYYFRKKEEKYDKKSRNEYLKIDNEILDEIDEYISERLELKPEISFNNFCNDKKILLSKLINIYFENNIKEKNEIINKVKKVYKNRVYLLTKSYKG